MLDSVIKVKKMYYPQTIWENAKKKKKSDQNGKSY